jgi:thioredoxin-like negative regulator of GroEL
MKEITDATINDEVNGILPVVIYFYAPWCDPCKDQTVALERLEADLERHVIFKCCDIDENAAVAKQYNIRGVPCMMVHLDGQVVAIKVGFMEDYRVKDWLDSLLQFDLPVETAL